MNMMSLSRLSVINIAANHRKHTISKMVLSLTRSPFRRLSMIHLEVSVSSAEKMSAIIDEPHTPD